MKKRKKSPYYSDSDTGTGWTDNGDYSSSVYSSTGSVNYRASRSRRKKNSFLLIMLTLLVLLVILGTVIAVFLIYSGRLPGTGAPANNDVIAPDTTPVVTAEPTPEPTPQPTPVPTPTPTPLPTYGKISFNTSTPDGAEAALSDYSGSSLIMLNFWEYWCPPCLSELPELEALYQDYKDRGFVILGIFHSYSRIDSGEARDAAAAKGVSYPVLKYVSEFDVFNIEAVPTTIFIDGSGNILSEEPYVGARSYDDWENIILQYLN